MRFKGLIFMIAALMPFSFCLSADSTPEPDLKHKGIIEIKGEEKKYLIGKAGKIYKGEISVKSFLEFIAGYKGLPVVYDSIGPGNEVFNRGNEHPQANRQLRRHDHPGQTENMGGSPHVLFHELHVRSGFDVQSSRVETNAFADERDFLGRLVPPPDVDESRRPHAGPPDGMDGRKVLFE